ncbi:PA14 domain protein [Posidoniimonas polymericola]|uniref:PA14 domain protein n=1 Tax=Posidoniimonas polymericola TaxID=2528002 RepID=A0A5C5YRR5_9BACT|nr:PA14 domain protein [Posidoniimonas polymericola]
MSGAVSLLLAIAAWFAVASVAAASDASGPPDGKAIYSERCAACHGDDGQGTDSYPSALAGDLPVSRLAEVITDTMPEGEPEQCTGADAEAAARYLYDAFYSPIAQARLRPPRVKLSRLTTRQHQQTLVDLAQSFAWRPKRDGQQGLAATFYEGPGADANRKSAERIDPRVDFSLIDSGLFSKEFLFPPEDTSLEPIPRANKHSVVMLWQGGVRAPETGPHEFIVETNAGFTLHINDHREPIIDGRVKSGDSNGGRARINLVEGRTYHVRLSVTRVHEEDVTVELRWKTPTGVEELIPARALSPHESPELLIIDAPLPPDDQSEGFVRAANVSAQWDDAVTRVALETADRLVKALPELRKLPDDRGQAKEKAREFCLEFADRAFRHPLSDEQRRRHVDAFFDADLSWRQAAKLSLLTTLKSPYFLYPELGTAGAEPDWRVASRLALTLWDSTPDEPLNLLARRGKIHTRDQALEQAHWMLEDPRAEAKLVQFFRNWLEMNIPEPLRRDSETYAGFSSRVADDMRTSLELFVLDLLLSESTDFRQLFLSQEFYLNDRLATFLGAEPPISEELGDDEFHRVTLEPDDRAGVVTHPFVVANHAYYRETSPIHRGVFLARHILGRALRPPPVAVAPTAPDLHPDMTTRERVALQTSPPECQHCHVMINDLGFSLEQFDAVGRLRDQEHGKPIDPSGGYVTTDGQEHEFQHARELAHFLADSRDVQRAFVIQLFEHLAKQPIMAYGEDTPDVLMQRFEEHGFSIRNLAAEIAATIAVPPSPPSSGPQG